MPPPPFSRRALLQSASVFCGPLLSHAAASEPPARTESFPLEAVRLRPSIFLRAVETNRNYLLSLEPDRLLHNFHAGAGLTPKGELYGGWEARGIAGHTLGHYLSACSLTHAQTGDESCRDRVVYIVGELQACQRAHGDGYVGGTTVERDGRIVDGKIVFEEVRRGEIRSGGFDLNGGWVPLYTWHKVHQGLLDAHRYCRSEAALAVAAGACDYLVGVLAGLDDEQLQRVLAAEHGGINETFAEMYARTGERRHLDTAQRIRHRAVLDPITAQQDQLAGLHANTQIPKVIGLARLYEVTGEERHRRAADFFWRTVTERHSFVIGGNSEREHFAPPGVVAPLLTDRTCEACNTYNMLRLTRHLWSWRPEGRYFDYYERAHLNHIMAHQHPRTGAFVYFMPMTNGGRRQYSTPTDSFWCCVGSGMESHAKHGEAIFGRAGDTLFVNLFIPSELHWAEKSARFILDTEFPDGETVTLRIAEAPPRRTEIALRLPAWCAAPRLEINGRAGALVSRDGYARVARRWRDGDTLTLTVPMELRVEPAPDDARISAFLHGPLVLAADLGPSAHDLAGPAPALTTKAVVVGLSPDPGRGPHAYRLEGARPAPLTLSPFYALHDRRTAVYLRQLSEVEWRAEEAAYSAAGRERAALDARTVDIIRLGEQQPERDHNYGANHAELISYEGVAGRQAWWGVGNFIAFDLAVRPGARHALHVQYWGEEIDKDFDIRIDGLLLARERRPGPPRRAFVWRDYPLPAAMTRNRERVRVRFETRGSDAPVYVVRMLAG